MTRIFEGKDIIVEFETHRSKNLWICFDQMITETKERTPWGYPFFHNRKIDCINVMNTWNHWYQTQEMNDVVRLVLDVCEKTKYVDIITYGHSMGGAASLMFANLMHATKVFCMSPIFFQDMHLPKNPSIASFFRDGLTEMFPVPDTFDGHVDLVYGKHHNLDQHIPEKLPNRNIHFYGMDTDDHTTLKGDALKDAVLCIEDGKTMETLCM